MEDKSKNIIIYFLLLIILVLSVIIGIMVIKKDADQKVLDNTKIGEKNTEKEPNKEESKEDKEPLSEELEKSAGDGCPALPRSASDSWSALISPSRSLLYLAQSSGTLSPNAICSPLCSHRTLLHIASTCSIE